jgi:hypothetical protein
MCAPPRLSFDRRLKFWNTCKQLAINLQTTCKQLRAAKTSIECLSSTASWLAAASCRFISIHVMISFHNYMYWFFYSYLSLISTQSRTKHGASPVAACAQTAYAQRKTSSKPQPAEECEELKRLSPARAPQIHYFRRIPDAAITNIRCCYNYDGCRRRCSPRSPPNSGSWAQTQRSLIH